MKLYNNETVKNYKTIQTNDGTLYPDKITTEQLNSYGYYTVLEEREDPLQFHTLEKSEALVGNEWVISYINVPVTLDEAKDSLKSEVISIAKQKLNQAVEKYSPAEMSAWESLEKEAISFLDSNDISLSEMIQGESLITGESPTDIATNVIEKATKLKQLRTYVVSERHKREQEINALTSIIECQQFKESLVTD